MSCYNIKPNGQKFCLKINKTVSDGVCYNCKLHTAPCNNCKNAQNEFKEKLMAKKKDAETKVASTKVSQLDPTEAEVREMAKTNVKIAEALKNYDEFKATKGCTSCQRSSRWIGVLATVFEQNKYNL